MPEESLPSAFPCPCARPHECRSPVPVAGPSRRLVLSLLPLLAIGCVSLASGAAVVPNPFVPPPAFPSWAPPLLSARPILIATARYNQRYPSLDIPSQSGSRYARPAVGLPQQSFFGQGGRQRSLVCSASTSQGLGGRFFGALKRGAGQGRGDSQVGHSLRSTGSLTGRAGSMEESSLHRRGGPRNALPPGTTPPDTRDVVATAAGETPKAGGVRAKPGSGGKKKVLILMSDTGGGHRASAQALESAFDELFPNQIEISIVDIWTDYAPWPYNQAVPAYQFMAKNPLYWKAFWEYGKFTPTKWGTEETSNLACHARFRACIESHAPDLVISVHPLCQDIPLRVLTTIGNGRRQIPFVTVVTDLGGAHPTWFHKDVDLCFVPSDPVRKIALDMGLAPDQIRQHGLPIRPGFWKDSTKDKGTLRKELQVKNARTALVVGGGDGIGNLVEITVALAKQLGEDTTTESQVVVICGKNEQIKDTLLAKQFPSNVNVVVKGFVKNMDTWMAASDLIVTKAGPGTIAEASTRGLPVMLFNFLPGQEEGNVPFVIKNGFGDYSKEPDTIARTVSNWLGNEEVMATMRSRAKEASRPSSTTDIAREIGDLLFGDWQLPSRRDTEEKFRLLLKKLMEPVTF